MNVEQRLAIERKIVSFLCFTMRSKGWIPKGAWDGEEFVPAITDEGTLDTVFSVDEAQIRFCKGDVRHNVLIVLGNDGWDCIADFSFGVEDDFEEIMDTVVGPFCDTFMPVS